MKVDAMGFIHPRNKSAKGEATIRTVHLTRRSLTSLRHEAVKEAVECMKELREAQRQNNVLATRQTQRRLDSLKAESRAFAAVAREVERDPAAFGIVP
jgi:hypothetical protein